MLRRGLNSNRIDDQGTGDVGTKSWGFFFVHVEEFILFPAILNHDAKFDTGHPTAELLFVDELDQNVQLLSILVLHVDIVHLILNI